MDEVAYNKIIVVIINRNAQFKPVLAVPASNPASAFATSEQRGALGVSCSSFLRSVRRNARLCQSSSCRFDCLQQCYLHPRGGNSSSDVCGLTTTLI